MVYVKRESPPDRSVGRANLECEARKRMIAVWSLCSGWTWVSVSKACI